MLITVRDNNVDQALRALKKKLQREGVYREMKLRRHYEKPSERRARACSRSQPRAQSRSQAPGTGSLIRLRRTFRTGKLVMNIGTRIDETGTLLRDGGAFYLRRDAGGRYQLELQRTPVDLVEKRVRLEYPL